MVCEHKHVKYSVKLEWMDVYAGRRKRELQDRQLLAVIRVQCSGCQRHYIFKGEQGFSTMGPTVSMDHEALRAPLFLPEIEKADPGVN